VKRRDVLGGLRVEERIILKQIIEEEGLRMWTGFIWLRVGSSGELL
jgi:hypothetical protein